MNNMNIEEINKYIDTMDKSIEVTLVDRFKSLSKDQQEGINGMCARLDKDKELKKLLDILINEQLTYSVCNTKSWEQVIVCRGTINGLLLLKEVIEVQAAEHKEASKPEEEFDKHKVL